jgi:hypothetical protein
MNILVVSKTDYFKLKIKKKNFFFIQEKKRFNYKKIKKIKTKYNFFPSLELEN